VELRVVSIVGNRITVSPDLEPKVASIKIEDLAVGQKVQGTVLRANATYGLFMDIGTERDALYRINQLEKPVDEYKVGEKVEGLRVASVNVEKEEVEVSTKQMPSECKVGEVLEGTVESITKYGVFFDANLTVSVLCPTAFLGKPASEYTVGEVADLTIMTIEVSTNRISVSTSSGAPISDFPRGAQVSGTITKKTQGGLSIDVGAILNATIREKNLPKPLSEYNEGDEIDNLFVVTSDSTTSRLEVSSTEALNNQEEDDSTSLSELKVGDTVNGKVSRVMEFGVFVDVGAERDALYSKSELDRDIKEFTKGLELTGLRVTQSDPNKQRLAVSSRKLAGDFSEGDVIDGKVDLVKDFGVAFGAFIEIGASFQALLPTRMMKDGDACKSGDELKGLVVVNVDAAENKMVLAEAGFEAAGGSGIKFGDLSVGQQLKGTVKTLKEYGAFVDIGLRRDALLPTAFVNAKEGMSMETLQVGDSLDVFIARIDATDEKISLSLTEPSEASVVAPGSRVGGGGKLPPGDVPCDPLRTARMVAMNAWGIPDMEVLDKYHVPLEQWAVNMPELFEFSEKETDVVLFPDSKLHFTGSEEIKQSVPFYIPVPVQLRADPTAPAEIPEPSLHDTVISYDYGTSHKIHRKYMQPPLNDPNWRWRPIPGEVGRYWALDANKRWGGKEQREPLPDWKETY